MQQLILETGTAIWWLTEPHLVISCSALPFDDFMYLLKVTGLVDLLVVDHFYYHFTDNVWKDRDFAIRAKVQWLRGCGTNLCAT
jgi:hypothetical protein